MWKLLAVICVAMKFVSAEKSTNRISGIPFLATYSKVPHHQPKYRAIIRKALTSVGVPVSGIMVLSLYKKNESYKETYKVTYETENGETCFMKWRVLAILKSSDPELPSCTKPDEEYERRSKQKSEHKNSKKIKKKKKRKNPTMKNKSKKKSKQDPSKKKKKKKSKKN